MLAGAVWSKQDRQRDTNTYSNFQLGDSVGRQSTQTYPQQDYEDMYEDDEDPWDVLDDDISDPDDGTGQEGNQNRHLRNNDLGAQVVVALKSGQSFPDIHPRSIIDFIDGPNMLVTYVPSYSATPLSDPVTARIFCHFVHVTGPCMSMFERHPANPSLIFQGRPIPASQQHIWTCEYIFYLINSSAQHFSAVMSLHRASTLATLGFYKD
jgi:hypothetical protein